MPKRTLKEWNNKFICIQNMMEGMDEVWNKFQDNSIMESYATMLRNPIIFDNNIKDVKNLLPYHIEGMENNTEDHLIGISNIVLYIFKKQLHKKWVTVDDFKNTLKALNILLPVSKKLNDNGTYKFGWKFDMENIEQCLNWDDKLKSVGVTHLVHNETKIKTPVSEIKKRWYEEFKNFL